MKHLALTYHYNKFFNCWPVLLICVIVARVVNSQIACGSQNGYEGKCVGIRSCPQAMGLLDRGRGNNTAIRELQKITCGFSKNDPKVCCPKETQCNLLPKISECGKRKNCIGDRIIGGRIPPLGFFPWYARLGYRKQDICANKPGKYEYYCGGSIINKRYILTAAHCTTGESDLVPVSVRLGEHTVNQNPDCSAEAGCSYIRDYKIDKIINHPKYNPQSKLFDIALVRINCDIDFSDFIQPVCLPLTKEYNLFDFPEFGQIGQRDPECKRAEVAGFGRTRYEIAEESPVMQYAKIPVVPTDQCNRIYYGKTSIDSTQMCAGGEAGQDSCDGDSGGPLTYFDEERNRHFQIGIVSYGPQKCGTKGLPSINTRLSEFITFIKDNMEEA